MNAQKIDRIRFITQHFNELQGLRSSVPLGLVLLSLGAMTFFPSWPLLLLQLVVALGATALVLRSGPYYRRSFGEVERQRAELCSLSVYSPAGPAPLAIEQRPVKPISRLLIPMALASALFLILRTIVPSTTLMMDGSGVDPWVQLHPPVVAVSEAPEMPRSWLDLQPVLGQGLYVLFGALFLGAWLLRGRRLSQSYYLALGALLLGLGMLGASLGLVLPALWSRGIARIIPDAVLLALAHLWMAQILCGAAMTIAGLLDHWQLARALRPAMEIS